MSAGEKRRRLAVGGICAARLFLLVALAVVLAQPRAQDDQQSGAVRTGKDPAEQGPAGERSAAPPEILSEHPSGPFDRARLAEQKRRWKEALETYRSARQTAPDDPALLAGESRCLLRLDQFREALAAAEKAVAAARAPAAVSTEESAARGAATAASVTLGGEALVAYGEALIRAGELERAAEAFSRAVETTPSLAHAHLGLGRMMIARGDVEKGIAELQRAYEIAPDDPDVLFHYAGALAQRQDAAAVLSRYLELSEGEEEAQRESVRATIAFYRALGETPLWLLQEKPARSEIPIWPISKTPGVLDGYAMELKAPEKAAERGKRVKERKLRCLLDTGASGLFLSARAAEGIALRSLSQGALFGGGGTGRHQTSRGLIDSLSLGEVVFRNAAAIVASGNVDPLGRYDGILGADVLDSFRLTIDLRGRRLVLEDPEAAARSGARARGKGPSDRSPASSGAPPVRIWRIEGQLLVRVGLNGGKSALMMLDTGASRTVLGLAAASGLDGIGRRKRSARTYGFGGSLEKVEDIEGLSLSFAGLKPKSLSVVGIDLSSRSRLVGTEISGYLGLDVLRDLSLEFEPGLRGLSIRGR